jgi:hypothetical protein
MPGAVAANEMTPNSRIVMLDFIMNISAGYPSEASAFQIEQRDLEGSTTLVSRQGVF